MLYIIPTYECNLNCQSCYSQKFKITYPECLSWERFIGIYNKFSNKLDRVAFIGGEAVKWKFINEAILFLKNKNIRVSLFSNGVDIPSALPDQVIINANNLLYELYSDKILKNIKTYKMNKVRITLRYNVDLDLEKHVSSLVDIAKLYADSVSLSALFPVERGNKLIGKITYTLAKEIMSNKIKTRISRAIPLCLFMEEQRVYLEEHCNMRGICSLPANSLVINPDGISAQPCVELSIIKSINSFSEIPIKERYKEDIDIIKNRISDECKECDFFAKKKCFGGCLAYK